MTVPAFVASGVEASGVGDITPALPAGWAAGHLLLLAVETANQAVSAPAGWTETTNSPQSTGTAGGTSATRLHVFQRIAQSGDTAPTVADSGDHQVGWITAFSGIDATTPVLHSAGSVLSSAGQTGTATGFTTTVADCLIVMIGTHAEDLNDDAACAVANANLTSVTVRKTFNSTAGNGGCMVVATGVRAAAGAIGSTTFEWTNDADGQPISNVQAMLVLALQETVAAPTEVYAVASGNSNSGATWNTGTVPTSTQDVYANGYTVTVNESTSWKTVRTTAGTVASAGGTFNISNGVTLTLTGSGNNVITGTTTCITYAGTSPNQATLVGNVVGSATNTAAHGVNVSQTGTFNLIGNTTGGSAGGSIGVIWSNGNTVVTGNAYGGIGLGSEGLRCQGTGSLLLNGDTIGSPLGGSTTTGVRFTTNGTATINGNATGGGVSSTHGVNWGSALLLTVNGNATGGGADLSTGVANLVGGTVVINGNVTGGSSTRAWGVYNAGAGTVTVNGNATGGTNATAYGASNTGTGTLTVAGKAISVTAPGVNGVVGAALTSVGSAETGSECINPINGKVVFASLTAATYGIRNSAATLGTLRAGGSRPAAFEQQVIG